MRKTVIVIPTYNEKGNVERMIEAIFSEAETIPNWEIHVLVVDSFSPDGTNRIVVGLRKRYPNLHLIEAPKAGLGRAYTAGFRFALDKLHAYLLFEMDADLSHNPHMIKAFLEQIEAGADLVIGSRYIKNGSIPSDWGWHRKLFSVAGNLIVRFGFMQPKVTDWTNGYRAIKAWVIKNAFDHISNYSGYVFQIALLDSALKSGARLSEIPCRFQDRKVGQSKINSIEYIVNILLYVFSHSAFIKFVIVGLIGFGIDFGISYLLIEKAHWIVWKATLTSTEIAIVSNFLLNNFWSFAHKKLDYTPLNYLWNFIKFNLISSGSVVIQTLGITAAVALFGKPLWYVYKVLIIALVIIPYSYVLYNKIIWKEKK
ncbi:glycosyltransferase [Patescibacteria group bacterium]|nr:glycosyltransferase [Patescibacteria group bacterium]MCL5091652.1 glycosyltransferase [Patescibacteria group bacterium]